MSATFYLVPHLTHRVHVYEFPNPFTPKNWGTPESRPPDPDDVDYVVVDRGVITPEEEVLVRNLVAPAGPFEVIAQEGPITVARRRGPGP